MTSSSETVLCNWRTRRAARSSACYRTSPRFLSCRCLSAPQIPNPNFTSLSLYLSFSLYLFLSPSLSFSFIFSPSLSLTTANLIIFTELKPQGQGRTLCHGALGPNHSRQVHYQLYRSARKGGGQGSRRLRWFVTHSHPCTHPHDHAHTQSSSFLCPVEG